MKFFHWDKQCKQEIDNLTQKHQVALKGITINEQVANSLRKELVILEADKKLLEQQIAYFINENKTLKEQQACLEIQIKEFQDAHTFALAENIKLKKELEARVKKKKINETKL